MPITYYGLPKEFLYEYSGATLAFRRQAGWLLLGLEAGDCARSPRSPGDRVEKVRTALWHLSLKYGDRVGNN